MEPFLEIINSEPLPLTFSRLSHSNETSADTDVQTYVRPPYFRAEMYAGRVACCPLASHGEYADRTDGRTP